MKPGGDNIRGIKATTSTVHVKRVKPLAFEQKMAVHKNAFRKLIKFAKKITAHRQYGKQRPAFKYITTGRTNYHVAVNKFHLNLTAAEIEALKDLGYKVDAQGMVKFGINDKMQPYAVGVKMITGAGSTPTDTMIKKMLAHSHSKMLVKDTTTVGVKTRTLGQLLQKHLKLTGVVDDAGFAMGGRVTGKAFDARLKKLLRAGYRPFDAARKRAALNKLKQLQQLDAISEVQYQALSGYIKNNALMVPRNCRGYIQP